MEYISRSQCFAFLILMDMPPHIVRHSIQVCRAASLLAKHIKNGLTEADVKTVETAGLIHDITKPRSFCTGEDHTETGGTLLTEMGYPGIGEIVRRHVVLTTYDKKTLDLKAAVVNYADKRVMHDKVVSLEKRMIYSIGQYGTTPERRAGIRRLWEESKGLEAFLFRNLPFSPEDLLDMDLFQDYAPEFTEYEEVLENMTRRVDTAMNCL